MKLSVNNSANRQVPAKLRLKYWLGRTLEVMGEEADLQNEAEGVIELEFVGGSRMRDVNRQFRGIDRETDVLSFSFLGQESFPGDNLVGQIFIEPEIAKKQAAEQGVSWQDEVEFLFVHALLHIFGFDHETEADFKRMYGLQAQIMPGPKWASFVDQIARQSFGRGASSTSHEQ